MPTILKVIVSIPVLLVYGAVVLAQVFYRRLLEKPPFDKPAKPARRHSELNKAH